MTKLFNRDKSVISRHIKNALVEECDNSVVANFATTANDGKTYQVDYYNLDMIISVGYRVKSEQGVIFRKWATAILKEYMLKGYVMNKERMRILENTVDLIKIASRSSDLINGDEAKNIINVIDSYSNSLDLLDDYDHHKIQKTKGTNNDLVITYEECMEVINQLRFNSESNLFALERNKGFESLLNNIYLFIFWR